MAYGKTIKIFLIDGDPNSRMACELSNWTGKAYKLPRTTVKYCNDREDLNNPGIYFLFGKDEEDNELVYIGEAERILTRLNQHLTQKDFWNETIVFISKDENLNKAHVKYLESRLFELTKQASRYKTANSTIPTLPAISEPDKAEMEEFLSNIKILVGTLGHKIFAGRREQETKEEKAIFYIKSGRGADAQGEVTSEGFVVYKGSKVTDSVVKSMFESLLKHRTKLIESKIIDRDCNKLIFKEDFLFSSPSTAAAVVLGRSANGLIEWKLKDGTKLKEFESKSTSSKPNN